MAYRYAVMVQLVLLSDEHDIDVVEGVADLSYRDKVVSEDLLHYGTVLKAATAMKRVEELLQKSYDDGECE